MSETRLLDTHLPARISRSRDAALALLIPRILASFITPANCGPVVVSEISGITLVSVRHGALSFDACWTVEGFYLRVSKGETLCFTGYVWPRNGGRYLEGLVHVMTWRRGDWEALLPEAPASLSIGDVSQSSLALSALLLSASGAER